MIQTITANNAKVFISMLLRNWMLIFISLILIFLGKGT